MTDMWGVSDVSLSLGQMQDTMYPNTAYDISVSATFHNLHNVTYIGGTAAFLIKLSLSSTSVPGQGNTFKQDTNSQPLFMSNIN